jgi:RNA polymerase sigma-70 factor (ECF subfamily)
MKPSDSVNSTGDHVDISGYLLQTLTPAERQQVEAHLAGCAECRREVDSLREWTAALEAVPEAMLLDGPPDDADLLLQRTLRQVRNETAGRRHRQLALVTAAAAVVLAAALGGGALLGRGTAPGTKPLAQPTAPVSSAPSNPPGTRIASATDPTTGARIRVAVLPAAGWVRVNATVAGIPAGERCRLEVVGRDGTPILAGSWLVSKEGEANGTTLNGSALIDPAQVASVRVVNAAGRVFTDVDV